MNDILAAAFGIAANRLSGVLLELYDAYNTLTKNGLRLSADDKRKFDQAVKGIEEIRKYALDVEFNAMVERVINKPEK